MVKVYIPFFLTSKSIHQVSIATVRTALQSSPYLLQCEAGGR